MDDAKISIVIPAFREGVHLAASLADIVARLRAEELDFELIVVDDGSDDDTWQTLSDVNTFGRIVLAAVMISINWLLFIYSIQIERVTESSLGYYIFPLVSVLFGWLVFGERLKPLQWVAVALAASAVGVLTIGQDGVPWISLILAITFGTYGVIKKGMSAGPVVSVTCSRFTPPTSCLRTTQSCARAAASALPRARWRR